jgi:hypothetical protein
MDWSASSTDRATTLLIAAAISRLYRRALSFAFFVVLLGACNAPILRGNE